LNPQHQDMYFWQICTFDPVVLLFLSPALPLTHAPSDIILTSWGENTCFLSFGFSKEMDNDSSHLTTVLSNYLGVTFYLKT
jgi:hypothetical protein